MLFVYIRFTMDHNTKQSYIPFIRIITASMSDSSEKSSLNLTGLALAVLLLSTWPVEAHSDVIYKYKKPNGKLLFTDKPIYKRGYILLNPKQLKGAPKNKRAPAHSGPKRFSRIIDDASRKFGVETSLIKAIIKAESDFDPNAVSRAGAQGLMQLMPKTARSYNVSNSFNSKQNIFAGTEHIKYLLGKYNNDLILALAAYNAGETAVNKYNGVPPFPETQRYVKKVLNFKRDFGG